eukprot:3113173-Rhodomonas_salina.2
MSGTDVAASFAMSSRAQRFYQKSGTDSVRFCTRMTRTGRRSNCSGKATAVHRPLLSYAAPLQCPVLTELGPTFLRRPYAMSGTDYFAMLSPLHATPSPVPRSRVCYGLLCTETGVHWYQEPAPRAPSALPPMPLSSMTLRRRALAWQHNLFLY